MSLIKREQLPLFHNGAGKELIKVLCHVMECENVLIKTSTSNDSKTDWCGYGTVDPEIVTRKEDYILLLSGMILASKFLF